MGMVNIRPYSGDDLDAVLDLFGRSVRGIAGKDYDAEQISAWAPEQPDKVLWARRLGSGTVLVAEAAGKLAGFARMESSGMVDLLFVCPAFARQGVASSLMSALLEEASALGVAVLRAEVSITARPFFEAHGFHVVRTQSIVRRGVELPNYYMERLVR